MKLLGRGRQSGRPKHGSSGSAGSPETADTAPLEAPLKARVEGPNEEVDRRADGRGEVDDEQGDGEQRGGEQRGHDIVAPEHDEHHGGAHVPEPEQAPGQAHGRLAQEEQPPVEVDGEPAEENRRSVEQEQPDKGAEEQQRPAAGRRTPLYSRLLRLKHVHPNGWQRALLAEGSLAVAGLLVLADLATAWTLLVLPVAVAGVVKANDLLAGFLARRSRAAPTRLSATTPPGSEPATDPVPTQAVADGPDGPGLAATADVGAGDRPDLGEAPDAADARDVDPVPAQDAARDQDAAPGPGHAPDQRDALA